MPRELVAVAPRTPVLREYEESVLGTHQIRIRTEFASPKHGTELVGYRGDPAASRVYDPMLGAKVQRAGTADSWFPRPLGNIAVGTITEVGESVSRFGLGDRVFGHFPIRETITVEESEADLLPLGLSPESAVCLDPAVMALAVRDANISLGDRIVVFGLGAIGLMAVQLSFLAGADKVIAVDPIESRRALAKTFGAQHTIDPLNEATKDVGLEIRRLTGTVPNANEVARPRERITGGYWETPTQVGQLGVDVAIEASGSSHALHQAIRGTRFGGTVCVLSFYGGNAQGLHLGEEFHPNRLQIISARSESLPLRDAPGWSLNRLVTLAMDWLISGRLSTDGIIDPVVSFEDSAEAYRAIDDRPEKTIKLGVRFP